MSGERFFLDTAYFQARIDRRDAHHPAAVTLSGRLRDAIGAWTTEAVLIEVGNALSAWNRSEAVELIEFCYKTENVHVIPLTTTLLQEGIGLYRSRPDKQWGLTDCISFVVMKTNGLVVAMTSDHHFIQAGFRALMLEES